MVCGRVLETAAQPMRGAHAQLGEGFANQVVELQEESCSVLCFCFLFLKW